MSLMILSEERWDIGCQGDLRIILLIMGWSSSLDGVVPDDGTLMVDGTDHSSNFCSSF